MEIMFYSSQENMIIVLERISGSYRYMLKRFIQQMISDIIFKITKIRSSPEKCSSTKVFCKYAVNLQESNHAAAGVLFQ